MTKHKQHLSPGYITTPVTHVDKQSPHSPITPVTPRHITTPVNTHTSFSKSHMLHVSVRYDDGFSPGKITGFTTSSS